MCDLRGGGIVFQPREIGMIDRMRADFIANASHELRTPLASIAGFIETLRGPARKDPAAQEQFLQIMQNQTGRMARLIDDLLSLSRLEMRPYLAPGSRVVKFTRTGEKRFGKITLDLGDEAPAWAASLRRL